MNSNAIFLFTLDILLFLSKLSFTFSFVSWVWQGWYFGWRYILSSWIILLNLIVIKFIYVKYYSYARKKK